MFLHGDRAHTDDREKHGGANSSRVKSDPFRPKKSITESYKFLASLDKHLYGSTVVVRERNKKGPHRGTMGTHSISAVAAK